MVIKIIEKNMLFTKLPQPFASVHRPLTYAFSQVASSELHLRVFDVRSGALLGSKRFHAVEAAAADIAPIVRRALRFRPVPGATGVTRGEDRTVCVQLSGVMMLDASAGDEAEVERIMRTAEERFAGRPGQVMFVLREGTEQDNSRFIPIASQNEGDWRALHEQATSDIVVAHSWFRTLSGLDYASGFNAERILHEYEIALNTVILGEQAELLEPVREILRTRLGADASSLEIVNRPPTRSKPIYMKVWEARRADGLDYDPDDERQQYYLSEIAKYNIRSIE